MRGKQTAKNVNMAEIVRDVDPKLSEMLLSNLDNEEQELFVKSFQTYLKYGDDDAAFVINFDDVWKWVGFSRKDPAKRLLKKNFQVDVDYIEVHSKVDIDRYADPNQVIQMTVETFKNYCMIASTAKSKIVRKYYISMERILHKYIENQLVENNLKLLEAKKDTVVTKHLTLLAAHDKKSLVYILKIECPLIVDEFLIKIGASKDIKDRIQKLTSHFGSKVYAIEIFPCEYHFEFEKFLHDHPFISQLNYRNEIGEKKAKSTECYLVKSESEYGKIKRIIAKHVSTYFEKNLEAKKLQINLLEAENEERLIKLFENNPQGLLEYMTKKMELSKIPKVAKKIDEIQTSTESEHDISPPITTFKENRGVQGPLVHIYDPNDFSLIKVFDGITEATRDVENSNFTSIKHAATQKLIYLNYRWFFVDRHDANPTSKKEIGPTVKSRERNIGFVAQLDEQKQTILKVFETQKDAACHISQHVSAMTNAIKYDRKLSGYYFAHWKFVCDDIRDVYLKDHELPSTTRKARGVSVEQLHPETSEIIKTHASISDVVRDFRMSAKTVKSVVNEEKIYNGYRWRLADI